MQRGWLFNGWEQDKPDTRSWWRKKLPGIRLHIIHREDWDRHMHDHPANFTSLVVRGAYVEQRLGEFLPREYAGGDVNYIRHDTFHYITEVAVAPVVTVVIIGKWRHVWGFMVGDKKVQWRDYFAGGSK